MNYTEMDHAATISMTSVDDPIKRRNRRKKTVYSTYVPSNRISRYNNTFQTLFPFGKNREKSVDSYGIFSFVTFHWIFSLLSWDTNEWRYQEGSEADSCTVNSSRLNGIFDDERTKKGKQRLSMLRVVWRFIRTRMIFTCILYIMASILSMLGLVFFLPKIMFSKYENDCTYCMHSWKYMAALIATELLAIFLYSSSYAINLRTAIKLRSACFASLYRQSMISSNTYKISSWQLITHLLSDGQHVQDFILTLPNLISSPIVLICCMLFAGAHLQLWGYLSVAVVFLFFPLFILIACLSKNVLHRASLFSDQRVHLLEEFIVNNICVKFFKRESLFETTITKKRVKELQNMEKAGLYDSLCFSCVQLQPLMSMSIIFVAYGLLFDNIKTITYTEMSEFAAICILIMINLKLSLENFWLGLNSFVKGLSSLHKYKRIMIYEVINFKRKEYQEKRIFISMKGASFQWMKHNTLDPQSKVTFSSKKDETLLPSKKSLQDTLKDLNIFIEENKLIGICGLPGSGKSSLLKAIMGLLLKSKGELKTYGNFAYVQQDPVIFNESLKNNIIFGNEMNSQRYYHTRHQCEITEENFTCQYENDEIIDPKLMTLEQKQQIELARAIYSNADIILLDNPLSAMEPNKKSEIFKSSVLRILEERGKKIVMLVTEDVNLLAQCDEVYMMQNGAILQRGHHLQLKQEPEYMDYIDYLLKQNNSCRDKSNLFETTADVPKDSERRRLYSSSNTIFGSSDDTIDTERDDHTMVLMDDREPKTYNDALIEYVSHFGNCCSIFILVFAQIINAAFISFLPIFFIISLKHLEEENLVLQIYYGAFFFMLFTGILLNWYINKKIYSAALLFHDEFMRKLYKSTLGFFQSKSLRIISTLAVHLQLTDVDIPRLIYNILLNIFIVLMIICVIVFVSPWHIIIVSIILIIMTISATLVRRTLVNFTQIEIDYFNCIYTKIVTMLKARSIIQAYDKVNDFSNQLYVNYDEYMTNIYLVNAAKGWLSLVLQVCSVTLLAVIGFTTLFVSKWCPLIQFELDDKKIQFNISCAALAIVCTLQLCYALQKSFLLYVNAGSSLDMLTEIQDFKMKIDQEIEIENSQKLDRNKPFSISFRSVSVLALEDMRFKIKENDKIGFVGLTSSERKAIISVLYKLTDTYTGLVEIDHNDISKISCNELRSFISVIPSEPYLFNTTIKKMFVQDIKIQNVLNKFMIWERIERLPDKLETNVDQMLTFQEKQMLLFAQAHVKQNPIIIIEDFVNGSNLEYILNNDLQKSFPKSTIIIFANDMNGLEDCNRVIKFKDGKIDNINNRKRGKKPQLVLMTDSDALETEF